jgi:hypothetical protein
MSSVQTTADNGPVLFLLLFGKGQVLKHPGASRAIPHVRVLCKYLPGGSWMFLVELFVFPEAVRQFVLLSVEIYIGIIKRDDVCQLYFIATGRHSPNLRHRYSGVLISWLVKDSPKFVGFERLQLVERIASSSSERL